MLFGVLTWQPAWAQSLQEVVGRVVVEHPEIQAAAANRRAIDAEYDQAFAGFKPTIDLEAATGYQRDDTLATRQRAGRGTGSGTVDAWRNEARATLRQMLFDGRDVLAQVDRARGRQRSAAWRIVDTAQFQGLRAVEVYLEVLRRRELVRLAEENFQIHIDILGKSRERAESGVGRAADLDQAEARHARAAASLIQSRGDLLEAQDNYTRIVGEAPGELSDPTVPRDRVAQDMQTALARGQADHPAIRIAMADIKVSEADSLRAEAPFYPRVELEVSGAREKNAEATSDNATTLSALLRFRYNLYRGGADEARQRETLEREYESRSVLDNIRRIVDEDVRTSWHALMTAEERQPALEQHVISADRVRFAYREQFDIGDRSLLDLLDSENELFAAQSNAVTGKYLAMLAAYRVLTASGELLQAMAISVPDDAARRAGPDACGPEARVGYSPNCWVDRALE